MHDEKSFLRPKSQKRQHTGKDEFHFWKLNSWGGKGTGGQVVQYTR